MGYGGIKPAQEYIISYLIEQSLSVDNMLVFLALFDYFNVSIKHQRRLLRWGILGAMILRLIMISLGTIVVTSFNGVLIFFAIFLIYSSLHMLWRFIRSGSGSDNNNGEGDDDDDEDYSNNWIVRLATYLFPATDKLDGDKFFTTITIDNNDNANDCNDCNIPSSTTSNVKKVATPLFICMIAIEISDVVFAVDSIPAIFGITQNPFIIFTSNIFAIMGLRSLFIILSKAADDLQYLEPSVAIVLGFIGVKMICEICFNIEFPIVLTLGFIISMLCCGCVLSACLKDDRIVEEDSDYDCILNDDEVKALAIEMAVKQQQQELQKLKNNDCHNNYNNDDEIDDDLDTSSSNSTEDETVLEL